jgi:hypothetical protein
MRLTINGNQVVIPTSLTEFTLGQRIAFQEEYGNDLDAWLQKILSMEEGLDKELEVAEFQIEKMFRTFAFFTGCTPEALKESEFVDDIANIYYACMSVLFESEDEVKIEQQYSWRGEVWVIHPPHLKQDSKMKFGEFIDAKQIVKDLSDLGKSQWDKLLRLCAIYLRKPDEEYQEAFMYENSERIELMKHLPMDIAMGVGFFLTASMHLYMNHFRSFSPAEQKEVVASLLNISKDGVGSTS